MNFIEILLSEKLKNRNPMLDLWGADRKVLQMACQDLANYLKVHLGLIGEEVSDYKLVEKLEELYREEPAELEEFIDVWAGVWLKKWLERVKLLIGEDGSRKWCTLSQKISKAEPIWRSLSNRKEMQEAVISALIRNGEICGTAVLSENLLKLELSENWEKYSNEVERIIKVVSNAMRRAREMARSKGPLIFVKIDKGFYSNDKI
ncbi:MAG: hypothetical protein QW707_02610 [Candidatus Bathyarchaeia archaeon]